MGLHAIFTINGVEYKVPTNLPADTTLHTFLTHHAHLHDTKTMCNEGGCGACVVSARMVHPVTGKKECRAINSCLVYAYSCHGWEITTTSGLGDKKSGYHTLHTTLAKFDGSQCGYCSPGMIMNMHSLMEENENLTKSQVENSFSGNLCRCTGYRPILDAFKSLASDAEWTLVDTLEDIEDLHISKMCPKSGIQCSGLCSNSNQLEVGVDDIFWFKVLYVKNVLDIMRRNNGAPIKLVAGSTARGVYREQITPKIYIDVNGISELRKYSVDKDITLGANVTLAETMKYLTHASGMAQFSYVEEIVKHIDLVANVPVRNIGTIAGNLMIKKHHREFPSDIFILLEAAGAMLEIVDINGIDIRLPPSAFLDLEMHNKIITSVSLPSITGNYAFKSYKIMPRAQNAHAYVNAAFYVRFDNSTGNVEKAVLVFGGINPSFTHARETENLIRGLNIFDNTNLLKVLTCLDSEIQPDWVLPDATPEYRKKLAVCLFYKFVLNMCPEKLLSSKNKSGADILTRSLSSGQQRYETKKEFWPLQEPIPKLEAIAQCAGEAEYIAYIQLKPEELYASFVLARKPLTTITNIDAKDALAIDGVKAFFSAKDIPGKNSFTNTKMLLITSDEELFCSGLVQYYGQPVGVIVATTQTLAQRAAKMVRLDYSTDTKGKKPYVDLRDILTHENSAPRVQLQQKSEATAKGDDIAHIFIGSQDLGGQYHFSMETLAAVCVPTEDGLNVYPSTYSIDHVQMAISQVLNIPENRINIEIRRLGGSFGVKISRANLATAATAVAAYILNKPVRMVMSIEDSMDAIGKRYWCVNDYEVAVNDKGKIQYLKNDFYEDYGCSLNESVVPFALEMFENCYEKSPFTLNGYSVLTEKPSNTWCRAPGALEGLAMVENIMEHIAHVTGVDPLDVRITNMRIENNLVYDIIDDFRKKTDYDQRKVEISNFNAENRWRKRGIAIVPMYFPIIYYGKLGAMVCIFHGDGTVAVCHGGVESGQGINTKVAQVCAYTLGVPLDIVSIKPTNNMDTPNNITTGGSITSESCCYAVKEACNILVERLEPIKKKLGGNPKWPDLIEEAHKQKVDLQAVYSYNPDTVNKAYDIAGLSACEVEVDILTGNVQILRVDIREDTGESMSPEVDVGQVEGAFVMGLSYWLFEKLVYDKKTCELKTNRTWNYKIPGAKDIPIDFRIEFTRNAKNPVGILRSKATGEPAIVMAFVAVCAIRHALNSARKDANDDQSDKWFPLGAPTTPEDILLHANNDYRQFTI